MIISSKRFDKHFLHFENTDFERYLTSKKTKTNLVMKFSTPNITFPVFSLVHSTSVISSYSESPYKEMHCANCCGAEERSRCPKVQD